MEKKKKLKGKGWWADGLVGSEWRRFGIVSNLPDSSTAVASSLRRPAIAACLNRRHPTLPLQLSFRFSVTLKQTRSHIYIYIYIKREDNSTVELKNIYIYIYIRVKVSYKLSYWRINQMMTLCVYIHVYIEERGFC